MTLGIAAAFANSWQGAFVFDDQQSIGDNPTIRHLSDLGTVLRPPGDGATVQGRPILNLSLALNYALGGLNLAGFHAVNLAIHLGAALALFGLVRRTLHSDGAALAVALLWAVHPLQTESVTYIIQRAESLASLFYLLTLYGFVRAASCGPAGDSASARGSEAVPLRQGFGGRAGRDGSPGEEISRRAQLAWSTFSVVCCLLGMGTKEIVASAPVLVYAYDAIFLSESWAEPWRRRRRYYLALAATWLPLLGLVLTTHGRGNTVGFSLTRPAWQYWLTQFPAVTHYLRLALWPAPLIFDRGYDLRWIDHPADIIPYAAVLALLIARTGYELARRTPAGFLGLGFFSLLAPTSLVPGYLQTMAEHRMYLPLAAVLIGAAAVVRAEPAVRRWSIPLVVATAALWGGLTFQRNRTYASEFALWSDTVEKVPTNPNSQYNLGNAYFARQDYAAAEAHFRLAIKLHPNFPAAYNNLGNALVFRQEFGSAERQYEQAIFLAPKYPDPHNNLGNIYLRQGRVGDAIREYRATLAIAPGYLHAQHNLEHALQVQARAGSVPPR